MLILRAGNVGVFMKAYFVLPALALVITSCAKRPDAIVPADIPMAAYTNYSCEQLGQEMIKEQTALAAVSKQQHDAATGDAFGVFLIGVPMSSTFGGDKEGQVSVAKGKVQAIQSAMMSKGCNTAPPAKSAPKPAAPAAAPKPKRQAG
ncbi:hypothetical protein [Neorhizobium sp. LjRoot104]|uniref:hypothetical protein n=1 Tax=Neorhizobium sp. LjRoot104 TaxID=3342254 RepID=UPI003F4F6080